LWFDLDPGLEFEQVHDWGRRLKEAYHDALPGYVQALEVADKPELAPAYADFFARLGMTFDQGDYASLYESPVRESLAQNLFERALQYAPDAKAYLGLGMLLHRAGEHERAVELLGQGAGSFPQEPNLRLCLGIALMNVGRFHEALSHLLEIQQYPQAGPYLEQCRSMLNEQDRRR
jgi:tetratricopeptide (TPR) repeat protein